MVPVVRFRAAVSLLGRFPALAGVDLDVDAGEVVLLQGPNGAGKTTLLRACAGLVPITGGEAEGRDVLDALVGDAVRGGATVLMASHEVERAGALAGRVVTVAGGRTWPAPAGAGRGQVGVA